MDTIRTKKEKPEKENLGWKENGIRRLAGKLTTKVDLGTEANNFWLFHRWGWNGIPSGLI